MIKLQQDTWYYLYTDGKDIFTSTTAPRQDNDNKNWYYPDNSKLKMIGSPLLIGNIESSNNIVRIYNAYRNLEELK